MFLSDADLERLTGYRRPGAQVRWLRQNGVLHYVRADGKPVVPVTAFQPQDIPTRPKRYATAQG